MCIIRSWGDRQTKRMKRIPILDDIKVKGPT